MKAHLTDLSVSKLSSNGKRYVCWCRDIHGFGVRVHHGKTFVLKVGNKWYSLGRYPIISLKQARDEAKRRLALKWFPDASEQAPEAAKKYLAAIRTQRRLPTLQIYSLYLQRLPNRPLNQITAQQLYAALPEKPQAANVCFRIFKAFFSWCLQHDLIQTHPLLKRKQPNKTNTRNRLLTDDEIKLIWKESHNHNSFGGIVRLLLLTGQRLSQISNLQRTWLQPLSNTIVFPAFVMKGNVEHQIPLLPAVHKELKALPFPKMKISSYMGKFRAKLDIPHWTLHDARRYFSSTMAKIGTPIHITEILLAHKTGSRSAISMIYNRYEYEKECREAMEKYHHYLQQFIS